MEKQNIANDTYLSEMLMDSGIDDSSIEPGQREWPHTLDKFLKLRELWQIDHVGGSTMIGYNLREYLSLIREFESGVRRIRELKRIEMARTRNWAFDKYFRDSLAILQYRIILRLGFMGHVLGIPAASKLAQIAGMKIWGVLFFECGVA